MPQLAERFLSDADIAQRAYELWERRGCQVGTPEADWHAAKAELTAERVQAVRDAALLAAPAVEVAKALELARQIREAPPRPRNVNSWATKPRSYRRGAAALTYAR